MPVMSITKGLPYLGPAVPTTSTLTVNVQMKTLSQRTIPSYECNIRDDLVCEGSAKVKAGKAKLYCAKWP